MRRIAGIPAMMMTMWSIVMMPAMLLVIFVILVVSAMFPPRLSIGVAHAGPDQHHQG